MWFHISKTMTTISQNVRQTPTIDLQTLATLAYPILCIFLTIDRVENSVEQQEDQHAEWDGMNTIIKMCEDHALMNTLVLHLGIGLVLHPPGLRLLICLFTINFFYRHEANVMFPR